MNSSTCSRSTIFFLVHSAHKSPLARPSSLSTCPSRLFSQSSKRGKGALTANARVVQPKAPAERSAKGRMKEAEAAAMRDVSSIPNDMGMLPGTFVRPVMRNMPSLLRNPKKRCVMEWTWLWSYGKGLFSVLAYCYTNNPRLPLRTIERKRVAVDLHKRMYTAFAKGDLKTLRNICCDGLFQSFSKRISHRRRDSPELIWTLHESKLNRFSGKVLGFILPQPVRNLFGSVSSGLNKIIIVGFVFRNFIKNPFQFVYNIIDPSLTHARVLSDFAGRQDRRLGMRQVVVRIRSRQSLIKPSPKQSQADQQKQQEEKQKDCTEYLVIQRLMVNGVEGDWQVWGLANETTFKDLQNDPSFYAEVPLLDRMKTGT